MTARHEQITRGPAEALAAQFRALVPVLTTERLTLRAIEVGDFDAYAEIVCGERGRYIGGPMTRDEAWSDFLIWSSCWMLYGHGGWAVEETATGSLLGFVILGLEPGDQDVELGFLFREAAEGKGFAFEAASVVRDWGFETLKLLKLDSYVDERNTRSRALAERLGGTDETPEDWVESGARRYRHHAAGGAR